MIAGGGGRWAEGIASPDVIHPLTLIDGIVYCIITPVAHELLQAPDERSIMCS